MRVDALLASDSISAAAQFAQTRGQPSVLFGRFPSTDDDVVLDPAPGTTAAVSRLAAGMIPAALDRLEAELQSSIDPSRRLGRGSALRAITELGFALRGTGPALRASTDDIGMLLLVYQAARDTAGVRETIAAIDAARSRLSRRNLPPPVALAEAELFLGDSGAALVRLLAFDASWTGMERNVSWGLVQNGWLLGRTWLLLGDVATAMGRRTDATRAYRRVVALWEQGDAEVQPAVARARAALDGRDGHDGHDGRDGRDGLTLSALDRRVRPDRRVRYDAVLWMQPVVGRDVTSARPLARMGFLVSEQSSRTTRGGSRTLQRYDSISVDMPLLDGMGAEGVAIRRQIQSAAGSMTATTDTDSLGRIVRRELSDGGALPGDLRGLLESGAGFGPLATALTLPAHAVGVGGTWRDSIAISIPGAGGTAGIMTEATLRLTRITTAGDRRLAFIAIDASADRLLADGGRVRAALTGEMVRDLESGETLRLAASLHATVWTATGAVMPVRVLLTALREAGAQPTVLASR